MLGQGTIGTSLSLLLVLVMALAPSGFAGPALSGPADPAVDLVVPAGATVHASGPLRAHTITVLGTLVVEGAQALLEAQRIVVGEGGLLLGDSGTPGGAAEGAEATGGPGEDAGLLHLVAQEVVVQTGGAILGADGGEGGDARATQAASGGAGGEGGSVAIEAPRVDIRGLVAPGSGGKGGDAFAQAPPGSPARADGGDGGAAGRVLVNGAFHASPLVAGLDGTQSDPPAPICVISDGQPGADGAMAGGDGEAAGNWAKAEGTEGDPGQTTCAFARGGRGGFGVQGDGGRGGDSRHAYASGGKGGTGWRGGEACAEANGGSGGGSGLGDGGKGGDSLYGAAADGGRGGDWALGRGGDGGDACASANGGPGGASLGGDGGNGGHADVTSAAGGNGGAGLFGGNGGTGLSEARGGKGGDSLAGVGGNGGNGGWDVGGLGSSAWGGWGGNGFFGGGKGGEALSDARGGRGGSSALGTGGDGGNGGFASAHGGRGGDATACGKGGPGGWSSVIARRGTGGAGAVPGADGVDGQRDRVVGPDGADAMGGCAGVAPGEEASDAVTRTFGAFVAAELEFKDGGTGIHSPSGPCPSVVFGLRGVASDVFYYQGLRVTANLQTGHSLLGGAGPFPLGQPCPIPGAAGPMTLVAEDMNLFRPYTAVSVDQLLCIQQANTECFPDSGTSRATLHACRWDQATFTPSPADGRGIFPTGAGSRTLTCADPSSPITYLDGAAGGGQGYCQGWFFSGGSWGTDYCLVQVEDLIPANNAVDDTGYVVSYLRTDALVVDSSTAPPTSSTSTFTDCDFILALDLDASGWGPALDKHLAELAGWYDLGGGNGPVACQDSGGAPPPDRKLAPFP